MYGSHVVERYGSQLVVAQVDVLEQGLLVGVVHAPYVQSVEVVACQSEAEQSLVVAQVNLSESGICEAEIFQRSGHAEVDALQLLVVYGQSCSNLILWYVYIGCVACHMDVYVRAFRQTVSSCLELFLVAVAVDDVESLWIIRSCPGHADLHDDVRACKVYRSDNRDGHVVLTEVLCCLHLELVRAQRLLVELYVRELVVGKSQEHAVLRSHEECHLSVGIGVVFLCQRINLSCRVLRNIIHSTCSSSFFSQYLVGIVEHVTDLYGLGYLHVLLIVVILVPVAGKGQGGECKLVVCQHDVNQVCVVVEVDARQVVVADIELLQIDVVSKVYVCKLVAVGKEVNE